MSPDCDCGSWFVCKYSWIGKFFNKHRIKPTENKCEHEKIIVPKGHYYFNKDHPICCASCGVELKPTGWAECDS